MSWTLKKIFPLVKRGCTTLMADVAVWAAAPAAHAWEPAKPVEFVVSAGTGGGSNQMARLIQGAGHSAHPVFHHRSGALRLLTGQGSLGIFRSNPLAGSITTLALVMLLWRVLGALKGFYRAHEVAPRAGNT